MGLSRGVKGQLCGRRVWLHTSRLGAMGPGAITSHGQDVRQQGCTVAKANSLEFVHRIIICDSHDRKGHFSVTRKEYFLCRVGFSRKTSPRFGHHNLIVVLCTSSRKGGGEQQLEESEM